MKVTKHIEQLLRQGRKPAELVELGFPKSVVTRVRRQLREEKADAGAKVPKAPAGSKRFPQARHGMGGERVTGRGRGGISGKSRLRTVDDLIGAPPELMALVAAAREIGTRRRQNCIFLENNICIVRTWPSRDDIPQGIGEPVLTKEASPDWLIKPSYFYCALCSFSLEDRIADMESEVCGDPLSGAKDRFTCKSCGSRGWIAVAVKCIKCGRQTWWGWFPTK